ncbi:MAG: YggS family pyridoxal phosphate-dependent enzyme, partial [Bacteroidota bacterium]
KQGAKADRPINCLLQIHIAEEETKFGLDEDELFDLVESEELKELTHIRIVGLMGMATNTKDVDQVRKEFKKLKSLFDKLKDSDHTHIEMSTLSMGMSGDHQVAIEEGSNMVRIGSAIFGARNY